MPCSSAGRRKIPLTEDKIKEQQPAAQPVRQPRRQKLRSLWAQFQCRGVLRRHRIRRKRQHRWEKLWHKLLHNPIAPMVGETLYAIGFSAEYAVVRTGRRLQHGLRRLLQTVRELLKNIAFMAFPGAAQLLRDLFGPVVLALRAPGRCCATHTGYARKTALVLRCAQAATFLPMASLTTSALCPAWLCMCCRWQRWLLW